MKLCDEQKLQKQTELQLVRLGGKYERAKAINDFKAMGAIEKTLNEIQAKNPEMWLTPLVVRGQNIIRARRGLELVRV